MKPEDAAVLERALAVLRANGAPLLLPVSDGVLVGKQGKWAHGRTVAEALAALAKKENPP